MNKDTCRVILNWMLPAIPSFPSPAMSVMKSQLKTKGYEVKVVYWNFHLLPAVEHYWGRSIGDYDDHLVFYLSPVFAYVALEMEDYEATERLREFWNKQHKEQPKSAGAFLVHIQECAAMLKKIVAEVIDKYDYGHCLFAGFYQKLFQMYGADVVARLIKQKNPHTPIVLGGIDTKDEALSAMDNFLVYDYALWGEGEVTLLNLVEMLSGKMAKEDVGNFVWRGEQEIKASKSNRTFVQLDESVIPDYSDYFEQATVKREKIRLPIEGSRGCHWARCRFCFHNEGTRYRRKSPERIAAEIRQQMEKYGIHQISFLDNDTIGKDVEMFKVLLKELESIKSEYPDFHITRAEVVTRSLNADLVRRMAAVGFRDVQIGYESLSDHLLEKIHKCNSFSSNFLYIKWALLSGIKIRGANLIMNMLEETDDDLRESLDTLRFLRFMLKDMRFMHVYSTLWIKHSSRYFKEIEAKGKLDEWKVFKSFRFLPDAYLKAQNRYALQFYVKPAFNPLWDDIEEREWEYIRHPHSYVITEKDDTVVYQEYVDGKNVISETLSSVEWSVLSAANEAVVSFEVLKKSFPNIDENVLKSVLDRLKYLGILYYYKDYRNTITVINTECERNKQQRYT
ncbi:MAG: B12-binding domain-containing radical SAM protein [Prevotella sp.]